jgi:hypothetical protein
MTISIWVYLRSFFRCVSAFFFTGDLKKTGKKSPRLHACGVFFTMVSKKQVAEPKDVVDNTATTTVEEPKKKKKRAEGRPHKRLLEPMLFKRKEDVRRKLDVHKAKCVLLQERLELYEREMALRAEDA